MPYWQLVLNGVGFLVVLARDHLEVALNPNLRAKSPPLYQMCHSTAKTSALPAGSIPDICHFFYTGRTLEYRILHPKITI